MNLKGLEREVIVAYVEVLSWHLHGEAEKSMKNRRILDVLAKSQTKHLPVQITSIWLSRKTRIAQSVKQTVGCMVWGSNSGRGKRFFSQKCSGQLGPTQPPAWWVPGFSWE